MIVMQESACLLSAFIFTFLACVLPGGVLYSRTQAPFAWQDQASVKKKNDWMLCSKVENKTTSGVPGIGTNSFDAGG